MCVIVYKPAGVKMLDNDYIYACAKANPHGFGMVSPELSIKTMNLETLRNNLKKVPTESPCLIHFRFATHGSRCARNCHPFYRDNIAFMHNGILDVKPMGDKTDSETAFIKFLAPTIQKYGIESNESQLMIESLIGYSKFAFMIDGEVSLFGDFKYDKETECYFSNFNFSYELKRKRYLFVN